MTELLPEMNLQHATPQQLQMATVFGVIGGFAIAAAGYQHVVVEGLTDDERKGVAKFIGASLFVGGVWWLLDLDERWLHVETAAQLLEERFMK